eukprot:TRINITY_DN74154_c0_g1_i1.p1 TRINITY_DN74154_c0_g1~~TRINITY_DN74154_c0_g1_i1.p1  ORF type:complete len:1063 (-),score=147.92 TRINITY_DN74154_c0_g1_i1:134-3322(-)
MSFVNQTEGTASAGPSGNLLASSGVALQAVQISERDVRGTFSEEVKGNEQKKGQGDDVEFRSEQKQLLIVAADVHGPPRRWLDNDGPWSPPSWAQGPLVQAPFLGVDAKTDQPQRLTAPPLPIGTVKRCCDAFAATSVAGWPEKAWSATWKDGSPSSSRSNERVLTPLRAVDAASTHLGSARHNCLRPSSNACWWNHHVDRTTAVREDSTETLVKKNLFSAKIAAQSASLRRALDVGFEEAEEGIRGCNELAIHFGESLVQKNDGCNLASGGGPEPSDSGGETCQTEARRRRHRKDETMNSHRQGEYDVFSCDDATIMRARSAALRQAQGGTIKRAADALEGAIGNVHEVQEVQKIPSCIDRVGTKVEFYRERDVRASRFVRRVERDFMSVEPNTLAPVVNVARLFQSNDRTRQRLRGVRVHNGHIATIVNDTASSSTIPAASIMSCLPATVSDIAADSDDCMPFSGALGSQARSGSSGQGSVELATKSSVQFESRDCASEGVPPGQMSVSSSSPNGVTPMTHAIQGHSSPSTSLWSPQDVVTASTSAANVFGAFALQRNRLRKERAARAPVKAREVQMQKRVAHLEKLQTRIQRQEEAARMKPWTMWICTSLAVRTMHAMCVTFRTALEDSDESMRLEHREQTTRMERQSNAREGRVTFDFNDEVRISKLLSLKQKQIDTIYRSARRIIHGTTTNLRRQEAWKRWRILAFVSVAVTRFLLPLRNHLKMETIKDFIEISWRGFQIRRAVKTFLKKVSMLQASVRETVKIRRTIQLKIFSPHIRVMEMKLLAESIGCPQPPLEVALTAYLKSCNLPLIYAEVNEMIAKRDLLIMGVSGCVGKSAVSSRRDTKQITMPISITEDDDQFRDQQTRDTPEPPPSRLLRIGRTRQGRARVSKAACDGDDQPVTPRLLRKMSSKNKAFLLRGRQQTIRKGNVTLDLETNSETAAQDALAAIGAGALSVLESLQLTDEQRAHIAGQMYHQNVDAWWKEYISWKIDQGYFVKRSNEWRKNAFKTGRDQSYLWGDMPEPPEPNSCLMEVYPVMMKHLVLEQLREGKCKDRL